MAGSVVTNSDEVRVLLVRNQEDSTERGKDTDSTCKPSNRIGMISREW
jgi:hypothetical protein